MAAGRVRVARPSNNSFLRYIIQMYELERRTSEGKIESNK